MSKSQGRPERGEPLLFFDAETVPVDATDPAWQLMSSLILPRGGESEEDFLLRKEGIRQDGALCAPLGRIWMLGAARGTGEVEVFEGDGSHESERKLLEAFDTWAQPIEDPWWIGHNIRGYDIPFISIRALIHGMPQIARRFGPLTRKPWDQKVLDTFEMWPRTFSRSLADRGLVGASKLSMICHLLGIPLQEGVMGANVYEAFVKGDADGVRSHLIQDVQQVRLVFKKLYPLL